MRKVRGFGSSPLSSYFFLRVAVASRIISSKIKGQLHLTGQKLFE
jgi:hypothetical protein